MASSSSSSSSSISTTPFIFLLSLLTLVISMANSQSIPTCATNLVPCTNYLNSTKPPESCCKPIRDTIKNEKDCLCKLYSNPGLIQSFGINITQALELPKHCGVSADLSSCTNASAPAPSKTTVPKAPPTTAVTGKDNNGAGRMAWSGVSALLFFWVSILAY